MSASIKHEIIPVAGAHEDGGASVATSPPEELCPVWDDSYVPSSAELAALHTRLKACEQQLLNSSKQIELAVASSRVPMLISDAPKMARLSAAASGTEPRPLASPPPASPGGGAAGDSWTAIGREEVAAFFKRLSDLEESQVDEFESLRDAVDATRAGIEHLARDLQVERIERKEIQHELLRMSAVSSATERFQKSVRSELGELIRDSVTNVKMDVHSRVQLLIFELRGELLRACAADDPAEVLNNSSKVESSLREWLPQDSDGNVAATTSMLNHLGVFDNMDLLVPGGGLPDQLVARPNTRFIHRAVIAIKNKTGYPREALLDSWPEQNDARLEFINKVWSNVADTLRLHQLEFDAEGILKCTNRKGTRRLLQLLAIAAVRERGQHC